jgi:hypothetical protein
VERELDVLDATLDRVEHVARECLSACADQADEAAGRDQGCRGSGEAPAEPERRRAERRPVRPDGSRAGGREDGCGLGHQLGAQGVTELRRRLDDGCLAQLLGACDQVGDLVVERRSVRARAGFPGLVKGLSLVAHSAVHRHVPWFADGA